MSSCRQEARQFRPGARQVPQREASVILLCVPGSERVPPLTLRLMTRWHRLRSAALLSAGTSGSATKTKSSLMWRSMRRDSREGAGDGSLRKGRQMSSRRRSNASCAVRRRRGWGWVKALAWVYSQWTASAHRAGCSS